MGARWRHQLGDAVDQLQGREHQFTRILVGLQRLCVAFATAVNQISAALLEPVHGKRWTRTVTQQALQPSAVGRFDAHPGIDREAAAVAAGSCTPGHVFGVTGLNVAACHKGPQDLGARMACAMERALAQRQSPVLLMGTDCPELRATHIDDKNQPVHKRTALGRMGHENVTFAIPVAGQPIVAYMGDDARGEYIYKFVSGAKWESQDANPANRLATGSKYLDRGTLFVAKFRDDGVGEWIELSMKNPIVAANPDFEFTSDAEVAIFTRLAADAVGVTRMDRPEWGGVNPRNGEIYFTLTNNSNRTVDGEISTDAANPRFYRDVRGTRQQLGNVNGHIIRLAEAKPTDARFKWDIHLFASEAGADKAMVNLSNLSDANDLSSPDGLVFSPATRICWIQTDDGVYTDQTNCMMRN